MIWGQKTIPEVGYLSHHVADNRTSMTAPLRILQDVFGFDAFRPGQEAAIGALLAGTCSR